ncbi:MAG TPA: hypothetical protein VJ036_04385 [bacterium]|nr:hypothetical protein [bacterium]
MNKTIIVGKVGERLSGFYCWFKNNPLSYVIIALIIILGITFFPTGKIIADVFHRGPFVAGPYISLFLMFVVCALYTNIYLYLFMIVLFLACTLLSFVGIAMGSTTVKEILLFFLPVASILFINISIAVLTYKYKKPDDRQLL